jgi:hypothetical protein
MINLRSWVPAADYRRACRIVGRPGPEDVRYKVPKTVVIGHAVPGLSAAVADGGLAYLWSGPRIRT